MSSSSGHGRASLLLLSPRQQRDGQEGQAVRVREEISGLIQELRDFKKEQTGLSNDLDQLKAKRTELSEKLVPPRHARLA